MRILTFALATLLFASSLPLAAEEEPADGDAHSVRWGAGIAVSNVNTSPFLAGSVAVTPSLTIGAALAFRTTLSPLDSAMLHVDLQLPRGFGVAVEGGTYSYLRMSSTGTVGTGYGQTVAMGMLLELPLSDRLLLFTRRPWFRPPMGGLTTWVPVDFNDELLTINVDGYGTLWSVGLPIGVLLSTISPGLDVAFRTGFRTVRSGSTGSSMNSVPLAVDALLHLRDTVDVVFDLTIPAVGNPGATPQFSLVFQTPLGARPTTAKPTFGPTEPASSSRPPRPLVRLIDRPLVIPKGDFRVSGAFDAGHLSPGSGASGESDSFLLTGVDAGISGRLELGANVAVRMDASDRRVERGGGRARFGVTQELALRVEGDIYAYQTSPFVDPSRGVATGFGVIWILPLDLPWVSVSIGRLLGSPPLPGQTSESSIVLTDHIATIDAGGPGGTEITFGLPLAVTVQATDRVGFALRAGYRYQSIAHTLSGRLAKHSVPLGFDAALTVGAIDLIGTFDFVPRLMKSTTPTGRLYEGRLGAQWMF